MGSKKTNVYQYLGVLDEKREKELRDKMKEIEFRKTDYERSYSLQVDNSREHKLVFGNEVRGIIPEQYNVYLERELLAEAERLEREQWEEIEEKQIAELEKYYEEIGETHYSFLEQMEDVSRERDYEDYDKDMDKDDMEIDKDDFFEEY